MTNIKEIYSFRQLELIEQIEDVINKHFEQLKEELQLARTSSPNTGDNDSPTPPASREANTSYSAGLPFEPYPRNIHTDPSGRVVFGK